ncbi:MAG: NrfD/PsrC family molybdoenzyme membrane anchor subunit, partial [Acidobacteriota bacterium]
IPGAVGRGGDAWRVYDTGQTHRDSWGWKVSAYLWTKSIAAGCLLMVPFIRGWTTPTHDRGLRLAVIAVSFLFLLLTGALLVGDLKRPERFLWVLTRPQWRSWLTRGSYILLGFGAGVVALGLAEWFLAAGLVTVLVPVTVVLAASAAVYTAFLFWQSKGRDLWQSPLLPLHLLVQAIVAGLSVTLLICSWGPPVSAQVFAGMAAWLQRALVLNAGLILAELYAAHPTRDATAAARWARSAGRRGLLAGGVGLAGHAIPFVMLFSVHPVAASAAALAVLAGLGCYEHLFVRAGQSVALS